MRESHPQIRFVHSRRTALRIVCVRVCMHALLSVNSLGQTNRVDVPLVTSTDTVQSMRHGGQRMRTAEVRARNYSIDMRFWISSNLRRTSFFQCALRFRALT